MAVVTRSVSSSRTRNSSLLVAALAAAAVIAAIVFLSPTSAQAAAYKTGVGVGTEVKVGSATFVLEQYYDGTYRNRIIKKKSGKETVVAKKACAYFVTNGKYLFYAKVSDKMNSSFTYWQTIYRINLKSGKKKKLIAGYGYEPRACSGTYLYCGGCKEPVEGIKLYALNIKTKKKTYMRKNAGFVQYKNGKVVATTNTGAVGNFPIYLFNKNGKNRKKIANGTSVRIKGKRVYYCVFSASKMKYKVYRCNLKGKGKKAVTGWKSQYPSKYFK